MPSLRGKRSYLDAGEVVTHTCAALPRCRPLLAPACGVAGPQLNISHAGCRWCVKLLPRLVPPKEELAHHDGPPRIRPSRSQVVTRRLGCTALTAVATAVAGAAPEPATGGTAAEAADAAAKEEGAAIGAGEGGGGGGQLTAQQLAAMARRERHVVVVIIKVDDPLLNGSSSRSGDKGRRRTRNAWSARLTTGRARKHGVIVSITIASASSSGGTLLLHRSGRLGGRAASGLPSGTTSGSPPRIYELIGLRRSLT